VLPCDPMIDPVVPLRSRIEAAVHAAFGDEAAGAEPALHRSQHADYQADVALSLGRRLKRNPREVAAAVVAHLPSDDVIGRAEVSGPGFINLTLGNRFLDEALARMAGDAHLGVPRPRPKTVVVDYSAPNVAKQMHVGHLRSTIIGDALARVLELLGHTVIRQNHIGDWGTPFGMLIEQLIDEQASGHEAGVSELAAFYKAARAKFDGDAGFAERARRRVVLLQGGDAPTLALWRRLVDVSMAHFSGLYRRLGVTLQPEHVAGESRYNEDLPSVVEELSRAALAKESEGAMCVFLPGFTGREGELVPLIVRKQDGGYGYATTDLAALRRRVRDMGAEWVVYCVGAPQAQHLAMVFAAARAAGWAPAEVRLDHVAFGAILGQDKKMLKSRAGEALSLGALLDEAVERATKTVEAKSRDLDSAQKSAVALAVGIGAVKYADLANDRIKDYVFDWNRMLALDGNTGPYLMYAHARARSIFRKGGISPAGLTAPPRVESPEERALALALLPFGSTVERTAESLQPHRLCGFLYDLAGAFTAFYEACPVLKAEGEVREARLALSLLTARVLERGLGVLGIEAPDQM
jgi:arginyl-tRNA synthetase